jgi:hypothetical protein
VALVWASLQSFQISPCEQGLADTLKYLSGLLLIGRLAVLFDESREFLLPARLLRETNSKYRRQRCSNETLIADALAVICE